MSEILKVRNVTKSFGGLTAVHDLSFDIRKGETVGLIGPNGAGKTTLVNLLCGSLYPDRGEIEMEGRKSPACRRISGAIWASAGRTRFPGPSRS